VEEFAVFVAIIVRARVSIIDWDGLADAFGDSKLVFGACVVLRTCVAIIAAYLSDKPGVLTLAVFGVACPLETWKVAGLLAAFFDITCRYTLAFSAA